MEGIARVSRHVIGNSTLDSSPYAYPIRIVHGDHA